MAVSIEIFIMLSIDISNNVKICKVSYCEVNMVSVTSYTYPTETENDNSQFQSQKLRESINTSLESNISKFNTMEQSGLLDNYRARFKDDTFRDIFRSFLLYLLDSFHIYRHDISDKLVPYFHVTPESENANYKTWIAVTGMDSYIKIEQTGSNKFKVTDMYREFNDETKCFDKKCRDMDFSGRNVKEFIRLLSDHDQFEKDQISELTVAANALKMDVAKNNYNMNYSFDRQTERRMIELIREQKDLIPEKYLHQSSIKNLKLHKNEFSSLLADAERQVLEGSSFVLCCGEKINGTISELLRKKITDSSHSTKSLTLSESPSYDFYEEIFKKALFTPDECHLVRDSLVQDGIKPEKIAKIISCLSSRTGIGNLFYACSQAFHVANDNAALDVRRAAIAIGDTIDDCPSSAALNGRSYHQHVDFSEYGFTQTLCVLGAIVNNANDTFDVANYIYTTKGENIIHNDAEDDSPYVHSDESYRHKDDFWSRDNDIRNLRRNFSGNITIATYK